MDKTQLELDMERSESKIRLAFSPVNIIIIVLILSGWLLYFREYIGHMKTTVRFKTLAAQCDSLKEELDALRNSPSQKK